MILKCLTIDHSSLLKWKRWDRANGTMNFSQLTQSGAQHEEELSRSEKTITKQARRKCKFRAAWLEETDENGDRLALYIIEDKNDKHRAICSVCYASLNISYGGKTAIFAHARGYIHKQKMTKQRTPTNSVPERD